jgi:hypothetical protein
MREYLREYVALVPAQLSQSRSQDRPPISRVRPNVLGMSGAHTPS